MPRDQGQNGPHLVFDGPQHQQARSELIRGAKEWGGLDVPQKEGEWGQCMGQREGLLPLHVRGANYRAARSREPVTSGEILYIKNLLCTVWGW